MVIFLASLALITSAAAALLVIVGAGIRRQERCRCLTCQPPCPSAALTRRLVGLYVQRPFPGVCHDRRIHETEHESLLVADEDELQGRR
jgi:hypothetical protein